jgi:hypothetical protein
VHFLANVGNGRRFDSLSGLGLLLVAGAVMNNNVIKNMVRLLTPLALVVIASTFAALSATLAQAESFDLLTEERMQISLIAAKLSSLAYVKNATAYQVGFDAARNVPTYAHPDYDAIQFYSEEPDQALVARTGGRCYVAFRYVLSCVSFAGGPQLVFSQ